MAEETITNTPAVEAATVAPVVETTPVTTETSVVETLPVVETLLSEALKPEPAPVVEPVQEPIKTAETAEIKETKTEGQSEETAPPPVYEAFTLPEGVTLDEGRVKQFTDVLSDFELKNKVDHKLVQELGQKAVDIYLNEVKQAIEDVTKFYQTSWEKQKNDWKTAFEKDPEIGGNRQDSTIQSALSFIRTHGGTAEQIAEFRQVMDTSGLGNHPALIRLFANAGRAFSEGTPLAATKPAIQPKSKVATLYGKNS